MLSSKGSGAGSISMEAGKASGLSQKSDSSDDDEPEDNMEPSSES